MKAKEFIYNLRTNLQQLDSQIQYATDQHIMYMLDEARSILAGQKMDIATSLDPMSQFLDVKPEKADPINMGSIGDAKVLKLVIPKPIAYKNGIGIFTVGASDGQDSYTKISYSQLRTALYRKYTGSTPKWFWFNDALYLINREMDSSSSVRVRGIFDEPYRVIQAKGQYKYLKPFDWEYPLTLKDAKAVYQIAMSGDLGWGDSAISALQKEQQRQAYRQRQQPTDAETE